MLEEVDDEGGVKGDAWGEEGGDEDDCGICDAEAATQAAAVAWLLARSF